VVAVVVDVVVADVVIGLHSQQSLPMHMELPVRHPARQIQDLGLNRQKWAQRSRSSLLCSCKSIVQGDWCKQLVQEPQTCFHITTEAVPTVATPAATVTVWFVDNGPARTALAGSGVLGKSRSGEKQHDATA
jgi:hypothetical protein